jgi:hypothetical protein
MYRHFNGCKPLKMGAIRKPRFSDSDVEKAMDGFFNNLLVMGWLFVIVSISWARLRQRPDSLDQGPAQLLEICDLRLLVR